MYTITPHTIPSRALHQYPPTSPRTFAAELVTEAGKLNGSYVFLYGLTVEDGLVHGRIDACCIVCWKVPLRIGSHDGAQITVDLLCRGYHYLCRIFYKTTRVWIFQ